jgi:hypothetical protein
VACALALAQGYRPAAAHEQRSARRIAGVDHPLDIVVLAV